MTLLENGMRNIGSLMEQRMESLRADPGSVLVSEERRELVNLQRIANDLAAADQAQRAR